MEEQDNVKKNVKQEKPNAIKTMYLQNICDTILLRQIFSKDCLNGDQTRGRPTYNNTKQTSTIKHELKHLLDMVTNKYVMKHIIHSYTTLQVAYIYLLMILLPQHSNFLQHCCIFLLR